MYRVQVLIQGHLNKTALEVIHISNAAVKKLGITEGVKFSHGGDTRGDLDRVTVYAWDKQDAINQALKWRIN